MASNVLPLFWNLASTSKETRLSASADLVSSLEGLQQSFLAGRADGEPSSEDDDAEDGEHNGDIIGEDGGDEESGMEADGDEENEEAGNDPHAAKMEKTLIAANAEDVVYSIRRLIRGLGSSRESSRLGYAVALAEVWPGSCEASASSRVDSCCPEYPPFSHHK